MAEIVLTNNQNSRRDKGRNQRSEGGVMKCSHESCERDAVYRYAWPGRPEAGICNGHPERTAAIIAAMVPLSLAAQHDDNIPPKVFIVDVNCSVCDAEFKAKAADRRRGWGRFCSKTCAAVSRRKKRG